MMTKPLVSICIPAFNAENYIEETLKSILDQTFTNFEILICDDFSTDKTIDVTNKFNDKRITVVKNNRKGASSARNQAYSISRGKLIIFLDSDDVLPKNFLQSQLDEYAKSDPETVIYSGIGRFYNNDTSTFKLDEKGDWGTYTFSRWLELLIERGTGLNVPGRYLIPRDIIKEKRPWDETLTLNDDFPFFTKIYLWSNDLRYNESAALRYRSGNNSLSNQWSVKAIHSYWSSLKSSMSIILKNDNSTIAQRSCASLCQSFIFNVYPDEPKLIKEAEMRIAELGGYKFHKSIGGWTGTLSKILGWKNVKRLKRTIGKLKVVFAATI